MLKKNNRLKSKKAFIATYKNNNVINSEMFILHIGKNKTDKNCPTRVGFVVSKKVHKRAVKRNRIKRLLREVIRLMYKSNDTSTIDNYQSLIFTAKKEALEKTYHEVKNDILILLNKLAKKNIQ